MMNDLESKSSNHKPRFFDLQVNGYAGVDFNNGRLTIDDLRSACLRLQADGVGQVLATVITDEIGSMANRISKIAVACESDDLIKQLIAGIHIEGPFLNPSDGTVGAHPKQFVQKPNRKVMQNLLAAANGMARLVTLAPECDQDFDVTRFLLDQGIVVSAGHCDPTLEELSAAADAGLSMFTHVGNGCSLQLDRHDNIIQRVLSLSDRIWCCFIADGIHVPTFALQNYFKSAGIERCIVVSDAMAAAGLGPGNYKLGSVDVEVDENNRALLAGGDGRLAGSVATLPLLKNVLQKKLELTDDQIDQLLVRNPMAAMSKAFLNA